jgi:hypothetical protein
MGALTRAADQFCKMEANTDATNGYGFGGDDRESNAHRQGAGAGAPKPTDSAPGPETTPPDR